MPLAALKLLIFRFSKYREFFAFRKHGCDHGSRHSIINFAVGNKNGELWTKACDVYSAGANNKNTGDSDEALSRRPKNKMESSCESEVIYIVKGKTKGGENMESSSCDVTYGTH